MKKIILTAVLASCALGAAHAEQKIVFATDPSYPPFENTTADGKIVGFDIDVANAICAEIKADCTFKPQAFDSIIPALKFKRYDAAISAMDITAQRAKQVDFTNPYYDSSASYIASKDKDMTLAKAKVIGVQNGTTYQQYLEEFGQNYQAKPYNTLQNAILDLKNGRVDVIFGDTAALADWMKTDKGLAFVGEKVQNKKYFGTGMGIAVTKGNKKLVDELNKGLAEIKANGTYQQIYNKWMSDK